MWLLAACVAWASSVAVHGMICRADLPWDRVVRFLVVGAAIGVALIGFIGSRYGLLAAETWASALCYAFASELYIFLFTLAGSSVSANLLMALYSRPLTPTEVEVIYSSDRMVAQRVRRLIDTGFLTVDQGLLSVSARGARLQRSLSTLRAFFFIDSDTRAAHGSR